MTGFPDSNERKSKVLSFVEKDLFIVNNYESAPFKNKNHAIECLIPYHVFQVMADDIKFKGSDIDIDLNGEMAILTAKLEKLIERMASFNDEGFTAQLLLYHEQRYINSLIQQNKPPVTKKKKSPQLKSTSIRIPKAKGLFVYGKPSSIHIKRKMDDK